MSRTFILHHNKSEKLFKNVGQKNNCLINNQVSCFLDKFVDFFEIHQIFYFSKLFFSKFKEITKTLDVFGQGSN